MDEEDDLLFAELVALYVEVHLEVRALREALTDRKMLNETEIADRIEDIRREEHADLKGEALRRSFEKLLKRRPLQ